VRTWVNKKVDDRIARMVDSVRRFRFPAASGKVPVFVTISRDYGCSAFELAGGLIRRLNSLKREGAPWEVYDRSLVELVAKDTNISERLIRSMTSEHRNAFEEFLRNMVLKIPSRDKIFIRMARVIKSLAWHGNAIIIGRGGFLLCRDMPGGFHIQLVAPEKWRIEQVALQHGFVDSKEASSYLNSMEQAREQFFRYHFNRPSGKSMDFDLVINNSRFSPEQMVDLVVEGMIRRGLV